MLIFMIAFYGTKKQQKIIVPEKKHTRQTGTKGEQQTNVLESSNVSNLNV